MNERTSYTVTLPGESAVPPSARFIFVNVMHHYTVHKMKLVQEFKPHPCALALFYPDWRGVFQSIETTDEEIEYIREKLLPEARKVAPDLVPVLQRKLGSLLDIGVVFGERDEFSEAGL